MSLLNKGIEKNLTTTGKAKTLNPDAAEFVPFSLRSPSSAKTPSILKRSESCLSNNSDDEAHQFWRHQLPDDITPDFNAVVGEEESHGINNLPFSNLSILDDVNGTSSRQQMNGGSGNFQQVAAWDMNGDQFEGYLDDLINEQQMEGMDVNSLGFLASQFPGFAAESLAEVFYANGCDLNLTIEMLTQLELQVDNGVVHNINENTKGLSSPNVRSLDFPALSPTEMGPFSGQQQIAYHGCLEKEVLMFKSSPTCPSLGLGATDFASAVRKMDSSIWKYDKSPSPTSTIGSSRSSSYPLCLQTGDALANMYSEMRGEARDHARLRNAYFEQARQAYLVGHKALAKELSVKGQLHNIQMKAAHEKAQESIYYQRNVVSREMVHGNGRGGGGGQERIIDLHGLHVSEALHVLKRDLMTWRNIARSAEQRVQVYICVETGHHTKGGGTARLPVAVQRYLLEEEGLHYSEPQPGLLRVVLY